MHGYTISVNEAAKGLRVSERTVQNWVRSSRDLKIPHRKDGKTPFYLIADVLPRSPKFAEPLLAISMRIGALEAPADMELGEDIATRVEILERSLSVSQTRRLREIRSAFSKTLAEIFWTRIAVLRPRELAEKLALHPLVAHSVFGSQSILPSGQKWRDFVAAFAMKHSSSKTILALAQTQTHDTFQGNIR